VSINGRHPQCVSVRPEPHARRQLAQQLGVAAAADDCIGLQDALQQLDHLADIAPPLLLSRTLQRSRADVIFVRAPFLARCASSIDSRAPSTISAEPVAGRQQLGVGAADVNRQDPRLHLSCVR